MDFSHVLKSYRSYVGLTQPELSEFIKGTNRCFKSFGVISYHRWETGKVEPSVEKQALLLNSLGLIECAKSIPISVEPYRALIEYVENKYERNYIPEYIISTDSNRYTVDKEESVESVPNFIFKIQNNLYPTSDLFLVFNNLISYSNFSLLYKYYHSNDLIGHLLLFSFRKHNFIKCLKSLEEDVFRINEVDKIESLDEILFVSCNYALTKRIFKHQVIAIIECLYRNQNIKYVYVRINDFGLLSVLRKSLSATIVSKNKSWAGVLISSIKLKMFYASIRTSPCEERFCDVSVCYKKEKISCTNG